MAFTKKREIGTNKPLVSNTELFEDYLTAAKFNFSIFKQITYILEWHFKSIFN